MKVAVTSDHTGLAYGSATPQITEFIQKLGHEVVNYGPASLNMDDDYPDFIFPAAKAVASGECQAGIILGGSGQGEAMAANRIKGVRCCVYYGGSAPKHPVDAEGHISKDNFEILKLARQHNHANMLSLATRFLDPNEMCRAIEIWLSTPFSDVERHIRRVKKLDEVS